MKVTHLTKVASQPVDMPGATGCQVRWLVGQPDGAPNFAMRAFDVAPGGYTPKHQHPYENEVYVLEGTGVVLEGDVEHPLAAGQVIYVAPDEVHQFRNTGTAPLRFLCMVPHTSASVLPAQAPECGIEQ